MGTADQGAASREKRRSALVDFGAGSNALTSVDTRTQNPDQRGHADTEP